jgi:hypothetical protein
VRFGNDGGTARGRWRWDLLLRLVINVIQLCWQAMCHLGQAATHCGELIVDTGNVAVIDRQEPMLGGHSLRHRAFGHLLQLPSSNTVLPGNVLMERLLALKILRRGSRRRRRRRPHPRRQNAIRICTVRRSHVN